MSEKTCATCRHWQRDSEKDYQGDCCRHAPGPRMDRGLGDGTQDAVWPVTLCTDRCGEWAPPDLAQRDAELEILREALRAVYAAGLAHYCCRDNGTFQALGRAIAATLPLCRFDEPPADDLARWADDGGAIPESPQ